MPDVPRESETAAQRSGELCGKGASLSYIPNVERAARLERAFAGWRPTVLPSWTTLADLNLQLSRSLS
jgi:hypothetical protein